MIRLLFLIAITCILLLSCAESPSVSRDVRPVLDSLEHKLNWLSYRLSLESWDFYTTGEADSLDFYQTLYGEVVSDETDFLTVKNGRNQLSDEVDGRRWELIYNTMIDGRIDADGDIEGLKDSLTSLDIRYRAEFRGEKQTDNYLYDMYRTNPNRGTREEAYRAYVSKGDLLADGLERVFRLRNQSARKEGYNSYFNLAFASRDADVNEFRGLLVKLDSASVGRYESILAEVRSRLGISNPEIWDVAFAYAGITRQVDAFFPVDSQLTFVDRTLLDIGIDMDKLPIYFDLEAREGKSQFAYAFTIKTGHDMRVLANLSPGYYSNWVLMHEIGHTLHSAFISQERDIFANDDMLSGAWSEGMAQTVAGFMESADWLTTYAHVPKPLADQFIQAQHDLNIIALRMELLRLDFEYQAYANPNRDINKLYWDLFELYMRLPRHEELKPWAAVVHYLTHPAYLPNYLYADMIAAQTLEFLSRTYGTVIGNPMTRSFLVQNYYRFGARYDWRELLKRGTDQELSPKYLLSRLGLDSDS